MTEVQLGPLHTTLLGLLRKDHDRILATASGLDAAATGSGLFDIRPLDAAIQVHGYKIMTFTRLCKNVETTFCRHAVLLSYNP